MIKQIHQDTEDKMQRSMQALKDDLSKQRTGRANPALISGLMVSYYGSSKPMNQVASITVEGALVLAIKAWEKGLIPEIEKAISTAGLGLNPTTSGDVVRIHLPALTEERRKEMIKKMKADGENAKVAIRNIRRDANTLLKAKLKDKLISEDEETMAQDKVQKFTDKYVKEVDTILVQKEKELMQM